MFTSRSSRLVRLAAAARSSAARTTVVQRRAAGDMPVPQSSKAVLFDGHPAKEGWENTIKWWYSSSFVLICLVLGTTPETDISAWAQKEAAARLQLKAADPSMEFEFGQHYQDKLEEQAKESWDLFSVKAIRMTDEDDDDEEEDEDDDDDDDDDE